uniref:SAM domain-containing protein n=1 Tax=Leersia perrieri TaxID=77586 RepID=A0A0D9WA94_9ORYZ
MDWYEWLTAAALDPAVAYEYALVFSRNELEADDVAYFDHEFLHSMGVSVAKHRLEILKLARRSRRLRLRTRLVAVANRVARYVRALAVVVHGSASASASAAGEALVLMPRMSPSPTQQLMQMRLPHDEVVVVVDKTPRRSMSKPKPSSKEVAAGAAVTPKATRSPVLAIGGRGAATVHAEKGVEDLVRWDRLFQDLKPN